MKVNIKLNIPLRKFPAGKILSLEADSVGTLKDKYWARRAKDALVDKCIEFLPDENKHKNKKSGDK